MRGGRPYGNGFFFMGWGSDWVGFGQTFWLFPPALPDRSGRYGTQLLCRYIAQFYANRPAPFTSFASPLLVSSKTLKQPKGGGCPSCLLSPVKQLRPATLSRTFALVQF